MNQNQGIVVPFPSHTRCYQPPTRFLEAESLVSVGEGGRAHCFNRAGERVSDRGEMGRAVWRPTRVARTALLGLGRPDAAASRFASDLSMGVGVRPHSARGPMEREEARRRAPSRKVYTILYILS